MIREVIQTIPYTLPSDTDKFIVTVTLTENEVYYGHSYYATADKTPGDIFDAYLDGKDIYAKVGDQYIPFIGGNIGDVVFTIGVKTDGVLTEIRLTGSDDPDNDVWTFTATRSAVDSDETGDYMELENRPKIEGVTLEGDKTFPELNLDVLSNIEIERILSSE